MNAAARLVHKGQLSRHLVLTHLLTRKQFATLLLAVGVLLSALGVIYVTHITRILHANVQHNLIERDHLHVKFSQLLLERSTWMMQSRIQQIAETRLGMHIPNQKSVVVVHQ